MILKVNDRLRNRRVEFFHKFNATLKYDAVASVFSWTFVFDPDNREHIDLACIGHYHLCTIEHEGELILTGQILSQFFHDEPLPQTVTMSGYSLPGVLEDCEIPIEFSTQSNELTLKNIATQYLKPFGIKFVIDPSVEELMNQEYEETSATRGQSLKSYLSELASQKNIVVSNDKYGRVLFTRPLASQKPICHFKAGETKWHGMTLSFDGQAMHSKIFVVNQADIDDTDTGEGRGIVNPFVPIVYRPKTIVMNSDRLDNIDLSPDGKGSPAERNALSQELKNFTLSIRLDRWDVNGKIIRPGDIVSVTNPRVYMFKKTNWFVEEVALTGDANELLANLKCVLPSVYNGTTAEYIFKGINLH